MSVEVPFTAFLNDTILLYGEKRKRKYLFELIISPHGEEIGEQRQ